MTATVDWHDVQALVRSGYQHAPKSSVLGLQIRDRKEAAAWLSSLVAHVSTVGHGKRDWQVNVAFTAEGLSAFGLPDATRERFAAPFVEGMDARHRSLILGDIGANAPDQWEWGHRGRTAPLHILLLLYARDDAALRELRQRHLQDGTGKGVALIDALDISTVLHEDSKEHFGFRDGISNPEIEGSRKAKEMPPDDLPLAVVAPGEFILGYPDELGLSKFAAPGDFARNGTYMVLRQLEQNVAGFWRFIAQEAARRAPPGDQRKHAEEWLAAKLIGRWPSGAPLAVSPDADDKALGTKNDFGYGLEDRAGLRCPLGAHIRRVNPRDTLDPDPAVAAASVRRHRLIRRGRSYGERLADPYTVDGHKRGIMFIAFSADLERQFELVQQTWANNPNFAGLYGERDPLSSIDDAGNGHGFTIPAVPVRDRLVGLPRFVTVRGGAYLFLPGLAALPSLAQG